MTAFIGDLYDGERRVTGTGGILRVEKRPAREQDEGTTFIVVGRLLPSIKRRNFQGRSYHFQRGELGLSEDWELAHLWAPRFGDESGAGIMWAPEEMNQTFQNHAVEPWLESLRNTAGGTGGGVQITAVATSWDNDYLVTNHNWGYYKGAYFLKRVTYEISDCPRGLVCAKSGVRLFGSSVSMELDPPTPGHVPRVSRVSASTLGIG